MAIAYGPNNVLTSMIWESGSFASGNGATVLGWELTSPTQENALFVAQAVVTAFDTFLQPVMDTDLTLVEVRYESDAFSGAVSANLAGAASITGPPSNVTLLQSYYSIFKGRRNRGRSYWPGMISEGVVDERGTLTPAIVATLTTALNSFFTQITDLAPVVSQSISQSITPGQVTPPIIPWPQVATRVVQPVIATQRRRVRP